jgi:hypothetical protein
MCSLNVQLEEPMRGGCLSQISGPCMLCFNCLGGGTVYTYVEPYFHLNVGTDQKYMCLTIRNEIGNFSTRACVPSMKRPRPAGNVEVEDASAGVLV